MEILNADFEEDVYQCFYEFYHRGSNKVDMLRSKVQDRLKTGIKENILSWPRIIPYILCCSHMGISLLKKKVHY